MSECKATQNSVNCGLSTKCRFSDFSDSGPSHILVHHHDVISARFAHSISVLGLLYQPLTSTSNNLLIQLCMNIVAVVCQIQSDLTIFV